MESRADLPGETPGDTRVALGIDPGTAIVGYAIVESRGNTL